MNLTIVRRVTEDRERPRVLARKQENKTVKVAKWWPALAIVGLMASSVIGGLIAGAFGDHGEAGIDWELAGIIGTALGTTLLAGATGLLALTTWRDVSATQEMVSLTRFELEARDKPYVIPTVLHPVGDNSAPQLKVEFRNPGRGPAVRLTIRAGWQDDETGKIKLGPGSEIEVVGKGGMVSSEILLPGPLPPVPPPRSSFFVEGHYWDRDEIRKYELERTFSVEPG